MAMSAADRKRKQRAKQKKEKKVRFELVASPAHAKLIKEYAKSL